MSDLHEFILDEIINFANQSENTSVGKNKDSVKEKECNNDRSKSLEKAVKLLKKRRKKNSRATKKVKECLICIPQILAARTYFHELVDLD